MNEKPLMTNFNSHTEKVILLQYEEETNCVVIENYIKVRNKFLRNCCCNEGIDDQIDDFSKFDSFNKLFYVDGFIRMSDTAKIILWVYGEIREKPIPFNYSKINFEGIYNDSILQFKLRDIQYSLNPGQIINDTISKLVREKNRLLKYTTILRVTNHGFVLKKNVISYQELDSRIREDSRRLDSIELDEINRKEKK
jgi:hypothetical protein